MRNTYRTKQVKSKLSEQQVKKTEKESAKLDKLIDQKNSNSKSKIIKVDSKDEGSKKESTSITHSSNTSPTKNQPINANQYPVFAILILVFLMLIGFTMRFLL